MRPFVPHFRDRRFLYNVAEITAGIPLSARVGSVKLFRSAKLLRVSALCRFGAECNQNFPINRHQRKQRRASLVSLKCI